jgi:hypothetical protein
MNLVLGFDSHFEFEVIESMKEVYSSTLALKESDDEILRYTFSLFQFVSFCFVLFRFCFCCCCCCCCLFVCLFVCFGVYKLGWKRNYRNSRAE